MMVITEASIIAKIGRHDIYRIDKVKHFPLFDIQLFDKSRTYEEKYRNLLFQMNLQLGFYFSYTYDLTNTLQNNMVQNLHDLTKAKKLGDYRMCPGENLGGACPIFMWNYFTLKEFNASILCKKWIIPIVTGYIEQKSFKTHTHRFGITLISRRSRKHAGARYLKRGVNG